MDQRSPIPLGGSAATVPQQETSRIAVVEDRVMTFASLQEQLHAAQHKIKTLEKELDSNCDAAEKIVNWLLRERSHLRSSLRKRETSLEIEAARLKHARETGQLLFDALYESKSDFKCNAKHHKEITEALEESLKVTEEAIRKEAERAEEVRALREKLRIANNNASDERQLSRIVSQQIEDLLKLIRTQHGEIKQHQSAICDLRRINRVLEEENGQLKLRAENSSSSSDSKAALPTDTQAGRGEGKTANAVVRRLEEQIVLSREQTRKLLVRAQQQARRQMLQKQDEQKQQQGKGKGKEKATLDHSSSSSLPSSSPSSPISSPTCASSSASSSSSLPLPLPLPSELQLITTSQATTTLEQKQLEEKKDKPAINPEQNQAPQQQQQQQQTLPLSPDPACLPPRSSGPGPIITPEPVPAPALEGKVKEDAREVNRDKRGRLKDKVIQNIREMDGKIAQLAETLLGDKEEEDGAGVN
ncbi:hypothetical protein F4811DRAFT_81992 [Daldinia bambusicola]|nr:hypothetical protein F4811DRAFT_81992 [Daldinia bambusicola]